MNFCKELLKTLLKRSIPQTHLCHPHRIANKADPFGDRASNFGRNRSTHRQSTIVFTHEQTLGCVCAKARMSMKCSRPNRRSAVTMYLRVESGPKPLSSLWQVCSGRLLESLDLSHALPLSARFISPSSLASLSWPRYIVVQ